MKKILLASVLFAALLLVFGCSRKMDGGLAAEHAYAGQGRSYNDSSMLQAASMTFRDASDIYDGLREEEAASEAANLNNTERKLIKRAEVRIRVENLESANDSILSLMKKYDAYAASTYIYESSYNYSLRVPAPQYDAFLAEMSGMGRMISRSESTEDVTLRYYDLEGRLETKKELLRTFQAYLARARTIEEILAVEARISELQYDIEGTGVQLRNLANKVDYATIDLILLGPAMAASNRSVTFGEQIRQMFGGFGSFLSTVMVVLIGIVIYGIPILLLVVFFFWLFFGRIGLMKKLWQIVKSKKLG